MHQGKREQEAQQAEVLGLTRLKHRTNEKIQSPTGQTSTLLYICQVAIEGTTPWHCPRRCSASARSSWPSAWARNPGIEARSRPE